MAASASRERLLLGRGWRYTVIGAVCALANYLVILAVDFSGGDYLLGTVLAFLLVTPLAYALHSRFTFDEPLNFRSLKRFTAGAATAFPVALSVMAILCSGLHLTVAMATPIMTVAMFGWNFAAAHWAILPRFELVPAIISKAAFRRRTS